MTARANAFVSNPLARRKQLRHPYGSLVVRLREKMGVGLEDRLRAISKPRCDNVNGNTVCEHQRCGRVAKGVHRASRDYRRLCANLGRPR